MANRFPLTIDGSTIKELPSGDNLDLTGSGLVTVSNADIELDPNGSGTVVLKGNATKGAGQLKLNCENNSHGITLKGPPHSASANYTLTLPNTDGNADQVLKTDGSGNLDWVDSGGGGGAWNRISTSTISSSTSEIILTLSGYTHYAIRWFGINFGSNTGKFMCMQLTKQSSSSYELLKYLRNGYGGNTGISTNAYASGSSNTVYPQTAGYSQSDNGNTSGSLEIYNVVGMPLVTGIAAVIDDNQTYNVGLTNFMFGFKSPASTDVIGSIRLMPSSGNMEEGTVVLYGITTS